MNVNTSVIDTPPVGLDSTSSPALKTEDQIIFQDTTPIVVQHTPNALERLYGNANPFPDETPKSIIEKAVKIETLIWSSSSTGWSFSPLEALLATSVQISRVLGDLSSFYGVYRYLRCGFKINIKLNSTPYHQGCLVASWTPPGKLSGQDMRPEMACGNHGIILSASAQDQCEMNIPYVNFDPWWDLIAYNPTYSPVIYLSILNSLRTSNGAVVDSVPITIWISLTDTKVCGPLPIGFIYGSKSLDSTIVKGQRTVPESEKEVIYESQASRDNKQPKPSKEAQQKYVSGTTAITAITDAVLPLVKSVPLVGEALTIARAILSSLDKPTSDQPSTITLNRTWRGFTMLNGLDYPESLGQNPVNIVTKDIGLITSGLSVTQFASLPNFYQTALVSTAGVVYNIVVHPMRYHNFSTGGRAQPDFLAFAAATYSYWRGSIKYLFQFVGTAFYSCSFRISVYLGPVLSSGLVTAVEDGVPLYSKVITVRGDAWCDVEVPYLRKRSWEFTKYLPAFTGNDSQQCNPFILVEALTDVQGSSSPSSAVYYVNVYRAGGSDIQFSQLCGATNVGFLDESGIEYDSQCSLIDKFNQPFDPIAVGVHGLIEDHVCMADTSGSITDVCKRPAQQYFVGNSGAPSNIALYQTYPWSEDSTLSYRYQPLFWWSLAFAYWRGGMRIYGPLFNSNYIVALSAIQNAGIKVGQGYEIVSDQVGIHAEVPYYCRAAYVPTVACNTISNLLATFELPSTIATSNVPSTQTIAIAFGDDACYLHPIAPAPFAFAERKRLHKTTVQSGKSKMKTDTGISSGSNKQSLNNLNH